MKYKITIFLLLWLGSITCLHAQNRKKKTTLPEIKTAFIGNRNYIVKDEWQEIPIDTINREDMNSPIYGGKFYPMSAGNSRSLKEKRFSIANQKIEIWIDVMNEGKNIWKLESVKLEVINKYEMRPKDTENGMWRNFTSRLNQYRPVIYLSENSGNEVVVRPDRPVLVYPNGTKSDNRFAIKVWNDPDKPLNKLIYRFELALTFMNAQKSDERITIRSDKPYFLGFIK